MSVDDLKDLVNEARDAAKDAGVSNYPLGSCMNPRRNFWGRKIADCHMEQWAHSHKSKIYAHEGDKMPAQIEVTYKRECRYCKEPEVKILQE